MDILPYNEHGEVNAFFEQLAARCGVTRPRLRRSVTGGPRGRISAPPSVPVDGQAQELREFVDEWQREQKVAEMDAVMSRHLSTLRTVADRENWLFRVAAICRLRDRIHICHHLIAVGTPACLDLAREILRVATQEDELHTLSSDRVHLSVYQFVLADKSWGA